MCLDNNSESTEAKQLRRRGTVLAASCATFSGAGLLLTHGHPVFTWTLIALQLSLLVMATRLLARAKRLG